MPRAKLYGVLETLNVKGLVEILPETPQRYLANPISNLYEVRVEELRSQEQELKRSIGEAMIQLAQPTVANEADSDAGPLVLLHGRPHFPTHLRRLVTSTRTSLVILGDRLVVARLRLYEDILMAIARRSANATVRLLAPQNVVEMVDGRRIHADEVQHVLRRVGFPLGDAFVAVRDEEEYFLAHFVPNDLHASKGSDRIIIGRDPEVAALQHRLLESLWTQAAPWVERSARA